MPMERSRADWWVEFIAKQAEKLALAAEDWNRREIDIEYGWMVRRHRATDGISHRSFYLREVLLADADDNLANMHGGGI